MQISSPAFHLNGKIPKKYTCDGENISPPLIFEEIPAGTESLVLIVEDPDAPNGLWVHWVVWNMNIQETRNTPAVYLSRSERLHGDRFRT